ncbi:hypothetical protein [Niallia sp. 03133]|uniref:hypothetical protein n=1 Tax=Niallia sp. 03133 TaxID=3458060 RepID=UPI00404487B8
MSLAIQAFTNPANTVITSDTAGGTLPKVPVIKPAVTEPYIDGSNSYIWSPDNVANQVVTFNSTFSFGLPILALALPVSVNYAFAGNETVSVSGTLQVVNLLGIVIATIPLFTNVTNIEGPTSVEIASADTLLGVNLLGNTARITITATVTAPVVNTGKYLGQVTVRTLV